MQVIGGALRVRRGGEDGALVTAPVRDSLTGAHVLIPQGARLIGAYQDAVNYGDRRIWIIGARLILPNGWSMDLAGLEATLSSPRRPSSTMRIFSSAENCRRVARRISLMTRSAGALSGPDFLFIFAPCGCDEPEILPSRNG